MKKKDLSLFKKLSFLLVVISLTTCRKFETPPGIANGKNSGKNNASVKSTGEDFMIVVVPDTQYYIYPTNGGTLPMFQSQIDWIKNNRVDSNIVYVAGVGDICEHYDNPAYESEWQTASGIYAGLETITGLTGGIPYGLAIGNHDQSSTNTTNHFNQYFGVSRFQNRPYYGGHYGTLNNYHYDLFSGGGMDFVVIYFKWDPNNTYTAVTATWAKSVMDSYPNRKAILVTHFTVDNNDVNTDGREDFGPQSAAIYNEFKAKPNFFMMLGGHVYGEGRRQDTYQGNTVKSFTADYQHVLYHDEGHHGYLRLIRFSPSNDRITMITYSPYENWYRPYERSQYTRPWFHGITTSRTNDYDNNGSSQAAFFNTATWKIYGQSDVTFGSSGDIAVPGDYDANGKTDIAVFRPSTSTSTQGGWYVKDFSPSPVDTHGTGVGDIPTPGDFDGNGTTDLAIYRPSNKTFYVRQPYLTSNISSVCGSTGDIPIPADYDGDGKVNYATYNPTSSIWTIPGVTYNTTTYGLSGDIPVPGDYNAEGKNLRAVYRPSTHVWYINDGRAGVTIGQNGDIPVPGDYNKDGKTDIAVYRPSTGEIIISGQSTISTGVLNDKPVNLPYAVRKVFFP